MNARDSIQHVGAGVIAGIRQLYFPPEFRIPAPAQLRPPPRTDDGTTDPPSPDRSGPTGTSSDAAAGSSTLIAELATCMWYLKTKHFRHAWDDETPTDDDPRVRRALGRINRAIEVLGKHGVEVNDPTNQRYPAGADEMMRPIQFIEAAGITSETVTETVVPMVYLDERLVQRGEVFVAVPADGATGTPEADPAGASADAEEGATEWASPAAPVEGLAVEMAAEFAGGAHPADRDGTASEAGDDADAEPAAEDDATGRPDGDDATGGDPGADEPVRGQGDDGDDRASADR